MCPLGHHTVIYYSTRLFLYVREVKMAGISARPTKSAWLFCRQELIQPLKYLAVSWLCQI